MFTPRQKRFLRRYFFFLTPILRPFIYLGRTYCGRIVLVIMIGLGIVVFSLLFGGIHLFRISDNDEGCVVSIKNDVTNKHPLILKPGTTDILMPENDGKLYFSFGQEVFLACPGQSNYITYGSGKKENTIKCIEGTTFKFDDTQAEFNQFTCNNYPDATSHPTGTKCYKNYMEIEIGFEISTGFVTQITTCFDETTKDALYSSYVLTGSINNHQIKVPRPEFEQGDYYAGISPNTAYTRAQQLKTVSRLLKSDELANKYIKVKDDYFFLSRGHMAANGEFLYASQQRATFFYINVAPQWQIFNSKNWNSLEQDVRDFVISKNQDLNVYTGVWGHSKLPDFENKSTELYLYQNNNQYKLTVPEIYWKVLYEPNSKTAVAFIGHNSPYEDKNDDSKLCTDVCGQLSMKLHWRSDNSTLGYSYCCEYSGLKKVIEYLPVLQVDGLLV